MKKYIFSLMVMMLVSLSIHAEEADSLNGKYRFTADVELDDKTYANYISSECDVLIVGDYYNKYIIGLAGATEKLRFYRDPKTNNRFCFSSSNTTLCGISIRSGSDSHIYFDYNPETNEFVFDDIELSCGYIRNGKMRLISKEILPTKNFSGQYSSGSATVELKRLNDDEEYEANFKYKDLKFTMNSRYQDEKLTFDFDNMTLDEEQTIYLLDASGNYTQGSYILEPQYDGSLYARTGMSVWKKTGRTDKNGVPEWEKLCGFSSLTPIKEKVYTKADSIWDNLAGYYKYTVDVLQSDHWEDERLAPPPETGIMRIEESGNRYYKYGITEFLYGKLTSKYLHAGTGYYSISIDRDIRDGYKGHLENITPYGVTLREYEERDYWWYYYELRPLDEDYKHIVFDITDEGDIVFRNIKLCLNEVYGSGYSTIADYATIVAKKMTPEEVAAIIEVRHTTPDTGYFTLSGIKVANPQKEHIYIRNGKKFLQK